MNRILRALWLTAVWVALWGHLSIANVLSGLVVSGLVVASFETWRPGSVIVRPIAALRFALYFSYQLVVATVVVARTVIAPRDRVRTGIVAVPLRGCSDAIATLVADAISLTPGTLTLEVRRDPLTLYVHALDTRDITAIQHDVRRLEVLAIRAFGDADAMAGLADDDSSVVRDR